MSGDVLIEALRQAVRRPEVQEALTLALEEQLRQFLGGADHYVGKRPNREARDARIREKFNGSNYDELAREERLHPRHIRRIVHCKKKAG